MPVRLQHLPIDLGGFGRGARPGEVRGLARASRAQLSSQRPIGEDARDGIGQPGGILGIDQ